MRFHLAGRLVGVTLVAAATAIVHPSTALAAPSSSDSFADATAILGLPFTDSGDLDATTVEPDEPQGCFDLPQTVWYSFTPSSTTVLTVDLDGSDFGPVANVYQAVGSGLPGLRLLSCIGTAGTGILTAQAGTIYYIQVGSIVAGSANMQLNVRPVPGPANDGFASATTIVTTPFDELVDLTAATVEPGEPVNPSGGFGPAALSVWYSFTPTTTQLYSMTAGSGGTTPVMTVYIGGSLTGLTEVASKEGSGSPLTFTANAGTTYLIQISSVALFDPTRTADVGFALSETPSPVAGFTTSPSFPSTSEMIQFTDLSYDPAEIGFQSQAWDFGDHTTATGCCPTHAYATPGDYTVRLTVTTFDGRVASTTQVLPVRTHDVAITKFTVPTTASVGQTRELTIGVVSRCSPELVSIQLFKRLAGGGLVEIGSSGLQSVPGRQPTLFTFDYTFTSEDAAAGKVTFKAVAQVYQGRDARPGDNQSIAPAIRVKR